ncbi:MAG TPA: hypothetical protein VKA48_07425, partial [Gammaproteobacteria bacterium]|nr:hypothetical protein [Gammaproteobacteria bacterium]
MSGTSGGPPRGTLATRYLIGALVLLTVLGTSGLLGAFYLDRQRDMRIHRIEQRQEVQDARQRLQEAFWKASNQVEAYALTPDETYRMGALTQLRRMRAAIGRMSGMAWMKRHPQVVDLGAMDKKVRELRFQLRRLFAMHSGQQPLFVGMDRLEAMEPISDLFLRSGQLLEFSGEDTLPRDVRQQFHQLQYVFGRMREEVMLYVLGQIGLFGDPHAATRARNRNLD